MHLKIKEYWRIIVKCKGPIRKKRNLIKNIFLFKINENFYLRE